MAFNFLDINSPHIWLAFFCGIFLIEAFFLLTFRLFSNFWGNTINVWYDKFGIIAIMIDVLIVLIGFWITQKIYNSNVIFDKTDFKLWKFILIFLAVQMIHDLLFYFIIKNINGNSIFDLIVKYGDKHGAKTIFGDSFMVVLAVLATYGLLTLETSFSTYIICLLISLYAIGYLLYQRWE
jgi:hypothetical protein